MVGAERASVTVIVYNRLKESVSLITHSGPDEIQKGPRKPKRLVSNVGSTALVDNGVP